MDIFMDMKWVELNQFEEKAKKCIIERYTWENIRDKYEKIFL